MRLDKHYLFGLYETKLRGKRTLLTKNMVPGYAPFEETLIKAETSEGNKKDEFRVFDPTRSKLAAYIAKGGKMTGMKPGQIMLYLGASHGYTPSFVSDILGKEGFMFALDFAPTVVRDLIFIANRRENMTALLGDANHPEEYETKVTKVDYVYQDIAQREQAEIFIKNCDKFLISGGFGFLAVKARSVDVTKKPEKVFKEIRDKLDRKYTIVDARDISPFEKDHMVFIIKKK